MRGKIPDLYMSSIHLTDQGPWVKRLKQTHALGLHGVEIFGDDLISGNLTDDSKIEEVRNTASLLGLTLTAHPWFDWTEIDEDAAVSQTKLLLERCKGLGVQKINFHLNFFADLQSGPARAARIILPLLNIIEENNQKLYFENVPDYLENSLGSQPEELKEFFNLMGNHPDVGLNIDIGHAHVSKNFNRFIGILGDNWRYTHIADNCGSLDEHIGPGMGSVDWNEVIEAATALGYSYPFILEFPEEYLASSQTILKSAFMNNGWQWPEVSF